MNILIWVLAFILMSFWSMLSWLSHKLLLWAGQLPWEQTMQQVKDLPVPGIITPWWLQMVDVLAPILQVTQGMLGGMLQFAGAALPFVIGAIWLFGMLAIVVLTLMVSGGIWWLKRKRSNTL